MHDPYAGLPQNSSFKPNCICRGELAWVLIWPNWFEVTLVLGLPNRILLNALKASTRNWSLACSQPQNRNSLNMDRSQLRTPGERRSGEVG